MMEYVSILITNIPAFCKCGPCNVISGFMRSFKGKRVPTSVLKNLKRNSKLGLHRDRNANKQVYPKKSFDIGIQRITSSLERLF